MHEQLLMKMYDVNNRGCVESMNAEQNKLLDELYRKMYRFLFCYAQSALKNESLAEEAVQETFAIACRRIDRVCGSENPQGWLVETLKLVIKNLERRQQTAQKVISDLTEYRPDLVASPEEHMNLRLIYGDIADTKEFQLVYAIAVEGQSYIEIAEAAGITVPTCRKRFERAKKYLQRIVN